MTAVHGRYCEKLAIAGRPFAEGGLSFILPKGSEYSESLRKATLELRSEGQIDSLEDHFERKGKCHLSSSPRLSFAKLKTFFILAFVAVFLLFLEMVFDPQTEATTPDTLGGTSDGNDIEGTRSVADQDPASPDENSLDEPDIESGIAARVDSEGVM